MAAPPKPGGKGRSGSPLALFSQKNGRAANKESLLPGQMTTTTPGDPVDRSMNQYGKDGPQYLPDDGAGVSPGTTTAPIRDMGGGIRSRPRSGGLSQQWQRMPQVPF